MPAGLGWNPDIISESGFHDAHLQKQVWSQAGPGTGADGPAG